MCNPLISCGQDTVRAKRILNLLIILRRGGQAEYDARHNRL